MEIVVASFLLLFKVPLRVITLEIEGCQAWGAIAERYQG